MMEIGLWILSFCLMAIETCVSIYFFDTFMERKRTGRLEKRRFVVLYPAIVAVAFLGECCPMGVKVLLAVLALTIFCAVFYKADWKQCIFFSGLDYSLYCLADIVALQLENILMDSEGAYVSKPVFLALPAKLAWLCVIFAVRKIWKGKNDYGGLSRKEWLEFSLIPLLSTGAMLLMYYCYSSDKKIQVSYLFLTVGLILMNFLVMELMQDILEKGELLRESALTDQKKESQLAYYRDMQTVYERQGRKMHDYKNQIRTIQVLIKEGDPQAAATLAERLTESILVEMSAVNTNHPVVNAVLNQKFHLAREQGTSMIFKVGDMSGMRLNEEETVILLSNLLDNAIHECLKVVKAGRKAVIHIKLVQEGRKIILSVKNPVVEKVQITDGIVLDSNGGMHGIGLSNVKAVVDKYGGDFVISCDSEKFQAVVML